MTGLAPVLTHLGWLATAVQIGGGCCLMDGGVKTWLRSSELAAQGSDRPVRWARGKGSLRSPSVCSDHLTA